jgi:hypothetical protein
VKLTLSSLQRESLPLQVARVEITGLKKTKPRVVEPLVRIEEGQPLTAERLEATEQRLKRTNLFHEISFFYREAGGTGQPLVDDGYIVEIVLKEKVTLIPIPFFSASGGDYSYGIGLFNANLLGLRRQLVVFAMMDGGEPYGNVGYIDPTLAGSSAQWTLFFTGGLSEKEAALPDDTVYRRYKTTETRVSSKVRMRTKKRVQPVIGMMFEQSAVDEQWEDSISPPQDSSLLVPSIGLVYDDSYFLEYFNRGFVGEASVEYAVPTDASGAGGIGLFLQPGLQWSAALFSDHRFSLSLQAAYTEFPIPNLNTIRGPGSRVLPYRSAEGRQVAAGSVTYELPFFRPAWGTWTLLGFFDGGVYEPQDDELETFFGPGAGFRVYLSKVAFPAVGVDLGVDLPTQTLQASVTVGMSM